VDPLCDLVRVPERDDLSSVSWMMIRRTLLHWIEFSRRCGEFNREFFKRRYRSHSLENRDIVVVDLGEVK